MILIDTGPLLALFDRGDHHHAACLAAARRLPPQPLATTWPCFTEAMYLLGEMGGYSCQQRLWNLRAAQKLILLDLDTSEVDRMVELMAKYHDTPMDLADASLVAVVESRNLSPLFTFDSDFYIYRPRDGSTIALVP